MLPSSGSTVGSAQGRYVAAFLTSFWRRTILGSGTGPNEVDPAGSRWCLHAVISWCQELAKRELSFPLQCKACPSKLRDLGPQHHGKSKPTSGHSKALLLAKCPGGQACHRHGTEAQTMRFWSKMATLTLNTPPPENTPSYTYL